MRNLVYLVAFFIFNGLCFGQGDSSKEIERFSEEIEFINLHDFVYNRTSRSSLNSSLSEFLQFSDSLSIKDIESLLESNDGKIKALGLLSLYQKHNQKYLLRVADFLKDSTTCFREDPYGRFASRANFRNNHFPKGKVLYVADVARFILSHYSEQAGYVYFDRDLVQFLEEREGIEFTAGYLKMLKLKSTGGISPFREERQPLVDRLRTRIENIENEVDKAIYKIYLSADEYELFSQDEMIAELNFLGKESAKKILMRQAPTDDPDLLGVKDSERHDFDYNRMCRWILLNAAEVFEEGDTLFFFDRAKHEGEKTRYWRTSLNFPYWHIAAARVDEVNSSKYIKACIELYNRDYQEFERATLYAELWHRNGLKEVDFMLDWIFSSYALNQKSKERIDVFVGKLDKREDLILLKKIIFDKRFTYSMNVWSIVKIASQINKLQGDSIIEDHFTRNIWHPFGLDRVEWWRERALIEYPEETKEMLEKTKILINELRKIE